MVATYSPQGDLGGTLHYPSPSHVRHVEGTSAFKHLRRSLSRSPSKNPTFRLITSKSTSPSPHSPLSPSCISPPVRSASAGLLPSLNSAQPSPLATPLSLSPRKNRCSTRRLSPMRSVSRSRSSQRSPGRMSLSDSRNNGNATPQSSAQSSTQSSEDIENRTARSVSPLGDVSKETNLKSAGTGPRENHLAQHRAITKIEKNNGGPGPLCAKSSPLKRSDGIMNLDQVGFGSPAKRRSLHGANFGSDFDIFDHEAAFQGHPDSQDSQEASSLGFSSYLEFSFAISPLPKRTSSLRRTTLQHRHDKPTFARSKLHADLALDATASGQVTSTSKPRMSLDSLLPPPIRDSPFSSQGGLPNASAHLLPQQNVKQSDMGNTAQLQRHPLSRTITQSSSNSSLAEDSPTHIPVRQPDHRRPTVDFSKSLPLGMRPGSREDRVSDLSSQETSTELAVSTPENYKLAKPLPAAFMSTGLISKRHKDIDDLQTAYQGEKSLMPDTPCKRQSVVGVAQTALAPSSAAIKARHLRHSFGAPSTPISPHPSRIAPETLGKGVSIFGSNISKGKIDRRSSFLSFDGDDHLRSSPENVKSQTSYGIQMSPTPTKQAQVSANISRAHLEGVPTAPSGHDSIADPCLCSSGELDPDKFKCKLISVGTPAGSANKDSDKMVDNSSPIVLRLGKYSSISSFTASRSLRQFKSPTPLLKSQIVSPFPLSKSRAKPSPLSPASPIPEQPEQMSPHTPRESMLPPDPSGLSISARIDGQSRPSQNGLPGGASMVPPATPTAPRELFSSLGDGRSSLHLSHNAPIVDVDPSLTSRFDKVDLIGTGEFSHVYRVTQAQEPRSSRGYFSFQTTHGSPRTPLPDRVWAVKKSRHPIIGPKDRRRKLQEVNTLRSIGQADHVIHLIDSWEENNHLYIQTEFCEEGSLDLFLDQVGRKARLDDFRIWKIMLELSLGLKYIHDSGFIHLDLKPANILITFEGGLKISDFGMAVPWPAPPGIDGEGDREYIGPEILMGHFDKPSDIFALGLILLEIAGNVMLPDNGASWQRLRSGDMSDVPSLTWSSETSTVYRDSFGKPLSQEMSLEDFDGSDSGNEDFGSSHFIPTGRDQTKTMVSSRIQQHRSGELAQPPEFMVDPNHPEALDNLVRWMISPKSADRPVVDQILAIRGVRWAEVRRRAGATVYEGNWGPADEVLADDAEMIDV